VIGESYKELGRNNHQPVVVAYGLDKNKENVNLESELIRESTGE